MSPSETRLVQVLTRELRTFDGMERTPAQVRQRLLHLKASSKHKTLTMSAFICRIMDDVALLELFAKGMCFRDQDTIPSSKELGL
jgi:hypothetical protein